MSRYIGFVGIRSEMVETSPGLWDEQIVEKRIRGRIEMKNTRWSAGDVPQDEPRANHVVSFVASEEQARDFTDPVYVTWQGNKWVVESVTYIHPRIKLTLGKVYHGQL